MIKNLSKKSVIAEKYDICKSIFKKATGLMFSKPKPLVFVFGQEKRISLHMLFVFWPIDVLFLDKEKKAVEIKENFRPFSFYNSKNMAMYIIELPCGLIKKSRTQIGDKISF